MVQQVLPRRNELSDPAVANIDSALMTFSVAQPPFEPANAARFLVSAEAAGVPVRVLLNKADLIPADELAAIVAQVQHAWFPCGSIQAPHLVAEHTGFSMGPVVRSV